MSDGHAPGPSIWPVTLALGVTVGCAGTLTHWILAAAGVALSFYAVVGWTVAAVRERGR